MKTVKLSCAVALVLVAMPLASLAQDAVVEDSHEEEQESPISWSLTAASDYIFRGVSQSNSKPAAQAGITYTFPVGFYVGAWTSNVDFGEGSPDIEVDGYVGYNTDLDDQWNLDVSVVRYTYYKQSNDYGNIDYNEYIAKMTYAATDTISLAGLVAYANDYANSGADEFYYNLGSSFDVGNGVSLTLGAGYTIVEYDGGGRDDYFDGVISASRDFGMVNANLGYYDTFGSDAAALKDGTKIYDSRVALLLTIAQ